MEHAIDVGFTRIAAVDRHSFGQDVLAVLREHVANVQTARLATGGSGVLDFGPSEDEFVDFYENIPGASHDAIASHDLEAHYLHEVAETVTRAVFPKRDTDNKLQFHMLARSLLSCVILPLLDSLVDPDYLYQTVVFILDDSGEVADDSTSLVAAHNSTLGNPSDQFESDDDNDGLLESLGSHDGAAAAAGDLGQPTSRDEVLDWDVLDSTPASRVSSRESEGIRMTSPTGIVDEGYLEKGPSSGIAGTVDRDWIERYVKITQTAIVLYKGENGSVLSEIKMKEWPRVFAVDEIGNGCIFCVATRSRSHYFRAESIDARDRWLKTFDLIFHLRSGDSLDVARPSIRPGLALPKYTVTVTRYQRKLHHAEYCLLIRRVLGGVTTSATSWEITRRFREFYRLHKLLLSKTKFSTRMRTIQFPERTMTFSVGDLTAAKLESRRCALDNYLQALCADWDLGTSYELCQFLSNNSVLFPNTRSADRTGVVHKVTRVATTFNRKVSEFAESTLKVHQLRKGAMAPQELVFVRRDGNEGSEIDGANPFRDYLRRVPHTPLTTLIVSGAGATQSEGDAARGLYAALMLRLGFELIGYGDIQVTLPHMDRLLNNLVGGMLERFGRAEFDSYITEESWVTYVQSISRSIWVAEEPPRTTEAMAATKSQAFAVLKMCCPDFGPVIDQHEVDEGLLCFLACFRSPRLNHHFFLKLLDVCLKHFLLSAEQGVH